MTSVSSQRFLIFAPHKISFLTMTMVIMRSSLVISLLRLFLVVHTVDGFSPTLFRVRTSKSFLLKASVDDDHHEHHQHTTTALIGRRRWCQQLLTTAAAVGTSSSLASVVYANEEVAQTFGLPEMKNFVDPLFLITIPKNYFALRRSAKGDLPDAKTGQGRRGSSIFTAGDMSKAEVVAVERFPTRVLLEENGIDPTGDLSTFPSLGDATAIATLIILRRERDKPGQSTSKIVPGSISVSKDGKTLSFQLRTEIEVQKPELLMEEYGVSELFRITNSKASLESNDGNIMAVFASALEQDYKGPDGVALRQAVDSFVALDQSGNSL